MPSYRLMVSQGPEPARSTALKDVEAATDADALAEARRIAAAHVKAYQIDQWRYFTLHRLDGATPSVVGTWMPPPRRPGAPRIA